MNLAVAALLGLSLGQPPAADYWPLATRNIKLPIEYKQDRRSIRQVELYACKNGDQVWERVAAGPPTQEAFTYAAPADGVYWFHIVTVDLQGRKDPANLTAEPPAMKVLVDTVKPLVRFTNAARVGADVVLEWAVDDKFPNPEATRVTFHHAGMAPDYWQEVQLPPKRWNEVRFPAGTTGPVTVKVTVADLAGNTGEAVKEVGGPGGGSAASSTSFSPTPPAAPGRDGGSSGTPTALHATPAGGIAPPNTPAIPPPDSLAPAPVPPSGGPIAPPAPLAPPAGGSTPVAPPGYVPPAPPAPVTPSGGHPIAAGQGMPPGGAAVPPHTPVTPAPPSYSGNPSVLAVGAGAAAPPAVEMSRVQVVNYLRFDLGYEVEQRGPSGISRLDLWVTRDDGRTWEKWSQHDGRETPVRVALDFKGGNQPNRQPEGFYGLRLVPVSGAGLSEGAPVAGDAPDLRLVVDVTPPVVKIFEPASDPTQRDTLFIQWEAADRNFGEDPITLEWSEGPAGPWRSVVSPAADGMVPVSVAGGSAARRVPNTGRYPWRVPPGTPAKVYLKVTARDAAGNTTEVVTPSPLLIDLTKPRARISGIVTQPGRP